MVEATGFSGSIRSVLDHKSLYNLSLNLGMGISEDSDARTYYESAEWTQKENRQLIAKLRKQNKELRKAAAAKLAADEQVVSKGLEDLPTERKSLRNKPGSVAIVKMDEKVRDRINILNLLRYETVKKQKRVEELKTQYEQVEKETEAAVETDAGESEEAQKIRDLENRLDKANLKCKEAEHIRKTYEQIKAKLEQEHSTFEITLNELEQDIKKCKEDKKNLETMRNDAIIARDAAKEELAKMEKQVYEDRRKREIELTEIRKEAEEKKAQNERIERRIATQRTGSLEDINQDQGRGQAGEDEQQKIMEYESWFQQIKEATGVSGIQEVVLRFENQENTRGRLESLKKDNERTIERLKEEKEKLQAEYEEMKYSGEAKLSSGQRLLEEFEEHCREEEKRLADAQERYKRASGILIHIRSGVEHLSEKLKAQKVPSSQVQKAKVSPSSDEYVLDQLATCEEKLLKLLEELESSAKSVDEIIKQMEAEEFHHAIEPKLPNYNMRIPLPSQVKDNVYDDDQESGDEEDIPTRTAIKMQSQQLLDNKLRRRVGKRKKTKK
ncbi:hypothetical protein LSH36_246g02041 [Paralvinella palmiformis]|uniref:ODAD1 central coiled coil region domain-containing protein n=1 Tax=Paralvinella palmiformis TaxID=53620 RepID=A0AAD9N2X7_9ANNE|nr:hypothetical protein LSH36_246g02041 [Paralvinella palmiformis]